MATLGSMGRKQLSSKSFGLPKQRKYPTEDRGHAIAAKGRATQQFKRGRLSASQRAQIDRKANAELRK